MSPLDEREKMSFPPLRHTELPLSRRMLATFRISPDGSIAGRMYEYDVVVDDRQLVSESKG
jgi:alpha-D-ribose 1-methylphosphonate 5-triphosphate synthase subunit PhnI